jgi:NADP-dependent 3-hydroxy acid dehydrogenase YdfG
MADDDIWKTPGTIYHRDTYPYIDPSRPALSTKGKTAIVTGAGSGIGASIAQSLAKSGISALGLVGRTATTLQRTRDAVAALSPATQVHVYAVDILDGGAVDRALAAFAAATASGTIDIVVANAGYMSDLSSVVGADADDWWRGFEVNIRGNFHLLRAFAPRAAPGAVVVHVTTAAIYIPYMPGYSSYRGSKIGAYKVFEFFGHEMADQGKGVRTVQVHPGLVRTTMAEKFGDSLGVPIDLVPFDTGKFAFPGC